jgi:hypothetical protein
MARFKSVAVPALPAPPPASSTAPTPSPRIPTLFAASRPVMFREFWRQALNEVAAQTGKPVRGLAKTSRWSWNPGADSQSSSKRTRTRARELARRVARDRMGRHRAAILHPAREES